MTEEGKSSLDLTGNYYVCENSDGCPNGACMMLIPRTVQKPASHCESIADNVADMEIDSIRAKEILLEKYSDLFTSI